MADSYLMPADDLWVGEMRRFDVAGVPVVVLRLDAGAFAFEDRCAHLGVALSQGTLSGCTLTCPAHHYQYDASTGEGLNPRGVRLRRFELRERDGQLFVDVEGSQ